MQRFAFAAMVETPNLGVSTNESTTPINTNNAIIINMSALRGYDCREWNANTIKVSKNQFLNDTFPIVTLFNWYIST
ncbi:hypothetical protein HCG49_01280 [Arenibacter sp. 6A1]|uniref:hypothetical protein n=1 Tax=Arenibacter sp. 6A1 TaxID=2720391 RepID=UPI001446CA4D|nr:hypothetical protein [Arenibacter sp. 6A1]NKI25191.1 hypothetical protein [Arenibacter sp. 6A1]